MQSLEAHYEKWKIVCEIHVLSLGSIKCDDSLYLQEEIFSEKICVIVLLIVYIVESILRCGVKFNSDFLLRSLSEYYEQSCERGSRKLPCYQPSFDTPLYCNGFTN